MGQAPKRGGAGGAEKPSDQILEQPQPQYRQRSHILSKHKSSTIDITFYKPKLVLEFCEYDIRTGELLRKEVFREVEAILDPEYIGSYWDMLKDWLGDTVAFGAVWDNEESAK